LGSPYVEMFREFQKKLLEQHTVLFVIGYSFSDEHINNIIYQALAINSTINVVVFGNVKGNITKIKDNRIINIYGKVNNLKLKDLSSTYQIPKRIIDIKPNVFNTDTFTSNIHYFNYIVENFIPNVDMYKKQDEILVDFIKQYKSLN